MFAISRLYLKNSSILNCVSTTYLLQQSTETIFSSIQILKWNASKIQKTKIAKNNITINLERRFSRQSSQFRATIEQQSHLWCFHFKKKKRVSNQINQIKKIDYYCYYCCQLLVRLDRRRTTALQTADRIRRRLVVVAIKKKLWYSNCNIDFKLVSKPRIRAVVEPNTTNQCNLIFVVVVVVVFWIFEN